MARVLEGRNRANPQEAATFVDEFDRLEQEREVKLHELDNKFKADKRTLNKKYNEDQKAILKDAKTVGVPKGVVRGIADGQKAIRKHTEALANAKEKAVDRIDQLEAEQRSQAVDIVQALGENFAGFGLGAAAVQAEKGRSDNPNPVAEAAAKAWKDQDGKQPKH